VVHANDRILCKFILNPALWKPDELMAFLKNVIDWHYFTVKKLIEIM